jgi:hypothetical protein
MRPRAERGWDPHASYHSDGTFLQKTQGRVVPGMTRKKQPLTAAFRGSEHLGTHYGHGTAAGAVCDPKAFSGMVIVEPGILDHGSVGVDLVEPGYEAEWTRNDMCQGFYIGRVHQREVFRRDDRPSVVITIERRSEYR